LCWQALISGGCKITYLSSACNGGGTGYSNVDQWQTNVFMMRFCEMRFCWYISSILLYTKFVQKKEDNLYYYISSKNLGKMQMHEYMIAPSEKTMPCCVSISTRFFSYPNGKEGASRHSFNPQEYNCNFVTHSCCWRGYISNQ
jgi:hypothetical protein